MFWVLTIYIYTVSYLFDIYDLNLAYTRGRRGMVGIVVIALALIFSVNGFANTHINDFNETQLSMLEDHQQLSLHPNTLMVPLTLIQNAHAKGAGTYHLAN